MIFLDDDDVAKPHFVKTLIAVAENTEADVVTAGFDIFYGLSRPFSDGKSITSRYLPLGPAKLVGMLENVFGNGEMLVRKEFFVEMGGFTEDYGVGFEDYEFLAKVVMKGRHLETIPEALVYHRKHANNMIQTTSIKANQMRFLRAYEDVHSVASKVQQSLLSYTQKRLFERDEGKLECNFIKNENQTMLNSLIDIVEDIILSNRFVILSFFFFWENEYFLPD